MRDKLIQLLYDNKAILLVPVYKILKNRELAEDIIQDAALKIISKSDTVLPKENYLGWLQIVVMNQARVIYNKRKISPSDVLSTKTLSTEDNKSTLMGLLALVTETPEAAQIKKEIYSELRRCVAALPKRQRQVVESHLLELTCSEISAAVGTKSYDTIKANYRHAILKLRDSLAGMEWRA